MSISGIMDCDKCGYVKNPCCTDYSDAIDALKNIATIDTTDKRDAPAEEAVAIAQEALKRLLGSNEYLQFVLKETV